MQLRVHPQWICLCFRLQKCQRHVFDTDNVPTRRVCYRIMRGRGVQYFQCTACPEVKGSAVLPLTLSMPTQCHYQVYASGMYGQNNICLPCAKNTFTPLQNMSYCLECNANGTGYYQDSTGQSGCAECFSQALSVSEPECGPGKARVLNFTVMKEYFRRTGLHQHEDFNTFCSDDYST